MNIKPPVKPEPPVLEDVESFPDQAHEWGGEWEVGTCGGRICKNCHESSECEWCDRNALIGLDCLREQADNRNRAKERDYHKALERYGAQMDYYREITEAQ